MKSIMEQASSIIKAIEKAWISAENPKEFTVKIFEKEEKNFFGMTTKPAKIGIFFSDKTHTSDKSHQKTRTENQPEAKECRPSHSAKPTPDKSTDKAVDKNKLHSKPAINTQAKPSSTSTRPVSAKTPADTIRNSFNENTQNTNDAKTLLDRSEDRTATPKKTTAPRTTEQSEQPRRTPAAWNEIMINTTTAWIKNTLSLMGMHGVDFNTDIAGKNLKLTFTKPLIENPIIEKQLFRSIAHLIMASLRNQYKQDIKDLKVVLIRPQ